MNDTPSLPKLQVAEVLGEAMALLRARRSLFVGAALACTLPNFLLGTLGEVFVAPRLQDVEIVYGDSVVLGPEGAFRLFVAFVFAMSCATTGVMLGIGALAAERWRRGDVVGYEAIVRPSLARVIPLTCIAALVAFVTLLGMGCVAMGIVVPAIAAMAPAACVVERRGPFAAIERSIDLSNGNFIPIFGLATMILVPPILAWVVAVAYTDPDDLVTTCALQTMVSLTSGGASFFGAPILGVVYARLARYAHVTHPVEPDVETFA